MTGTALTEAVLREILDDTHRYRAGRDHDVPTLSATDSAAGGSLVRRAHVAREYLRDAVERAAGQVGFSRRHFDPAFAATRLIRLIELLPELEATYDALTDQSSRRAMIDLLKLRVLGPHHAQLAVSPERFRRSQAHCDAQWRTESNTFAVSDPWFSPLSRYRVEVDGGDMIDIHAHSVDLTNVYVLEQYHYRGDSADVAVRPGDLVLDVGGCWGDTALYFASRVGPTGRVFTFEFDPESLGILRANLALNPELASRVEIVERAMWSRSGDLLEFTQAGRCTYVNDTEGADAESGTDQGTLRVSTITLDDFVSEWGLDRVDFVKLDVEGAEVEVLAGAAGTLRERKPRLAIAAYHRDDDLITIPHKLWQAGDGYDLYLASFSPLEDESVLFAKATDRSRAS